TEINGTQKVVSGTASVAASATSVQSGFANNTVTTLTFTVAAGGTSGATTINVSDGLGGTASFTVTSAGAGASSITIAGGVNAGANLDFTFTGSDFGTSAAGNIAGATTLKIRGDYTANREVNFDVRGSNAGDTATLTTEQLVDGT